MDLHFPCTYSRVHVLLQYLSILIFEQPIRQVVVDGTLNEIFSTQEIIYIYININTFSVVPLLSSYRVSTIIEKRGKNEH